MKKNKIFVLSLISLFLLSFMTFSVSASPTDIPSSPKAGDILVYEVTASDLSENLDSLSNGTFTISNLVGTKLGFRIYNFDANSYEYGTYLQVGQTPLTLTLKSGNLDQLSLDLIGNETIEMELESIIDLLLPIGDVPLSLPKNSLVPIGGKTEGLFDISDFKGIILWIKNVDWNAIKLLIDNDPSISYEEDTSAETITLTLDLSTVDETTVSYTFSTASIDAVLTKLEVQVNLGNSDTFYLEIKYKETKNFGLPDGFTVGDVYNYKFDETRLDISHNFEESTEDFLNSFIKANDETGEFEDLNTFFGTLETSFADLKDQTSMEYKILSIEGTTFDAKVSQPINEKNPSFEATFDGFMSSKANSTGPLIIPDWNFWENSFNSLKSVGTFVTTFLSGSTANEYLKNQYTEIGFVEDPSIVSSFVSTNSEGIYYFSVGLAIDFKFSSAIELSEIFELLGVDNFPLGTSPFTDLTFTSNNTVGIAFSDEGYLLSAVIKGKNSFTFDVSLFNSGTASINQLILTDLSGSIDVELEMSTTLSSDSVNVDQSTLDDAVKANSILQNEVIKSPIISSPNYDIYITMVSLITVTAVFKRFKK